MKLLILPIVAMAFGAAGCKKGSDATTDTKSGPQGQPEIMEAGKNYHFRQWSDNKQVLVLNLNTNQFTYKYVDDASEQGWQSVFLMTALTGETAIELTAAGTRIEGASFPKAEKVEAEAGKTAYRIFNGDKSQCLMGIPTPTWRVPGDLNNCSRFEAVQIESQG